jgi:hypothetical protein
VTQDIIKGFRVFMDEEGCEEYIEEDLPAAQMSWSELLY